MTPHAPERPPNADALLAAAQQKSAQGDLAAAFQALKAALKQAPDDPAATAAMGMFLADHGEPGTAAQLLSRALELAEGGSEAQRIAPVLARLLNGLWPDSWHARLDADLRVCLTSPAVAAQDLARVTARTLLLKHPTFDGAAGTLAAIGGDALWLAFLTRCLNIDPAMESRLDAVRAALLAHADETKDDGPIRDLACAMALSGFASEYVSIPAADADKATGLTAGLFRPLDAGEVEITNDDGLAALLVRRTMSEPAHERRLADEIPSLIPMADDAVSAQVREQYEANPYPRWTISPTPTPRSLRNWVEAQPGLDRSRFGDVCRQVLTAGCGTGFEPIDMARMDETLTITALDLSRSSLAYGARVAVELGLDRVRFVQGDILALDRIESRFDVIVSTGVIHHMARPEDGLLRLAGLLRPGGVIRLGLYSERARALVKRAQALIQEKGWRPVADDIRAFRAHVLALPNGAPLAGLRHSDDFYSLSGCRDLVFHVQEHRYTPPQLNGLLASAGLRLVGFEASPEANTLFRSTFGNGADVLDLTLWDRLEQGRPALFAGMYHLWGQRASPASLQAGGVNRA